MTNIVVITNRNFEGYQKVLDRRLSAELEEDISWMYFNLSEKWFRQLKSDQKPDIFMIDINIREESRFFEEESSERYPSISVAKTLSIGAPRLPKVIYGLGLPPGHETMFLGIDNLYGPIELFHCHEAILEALGK